MITPTTLKGRFFEARKEWAKEWFMCVLNEHNWNITSAAKYAGINRTNFYKHMRRLGVSGPSKDPRAHRGNEAWRELGK